MSTSSWSAVRRILHGRAGGFLVPRRLWLALGWVVLEDPAAPGAQLGQRGPSTDRRPATAPEVRRIPLRDPGPE
jgi:hypothetical protein